MKNANYNAAMESIKKFNRINSLFYVFDEALYNKWPKQWGEAFSSCLEKYGWHLHLDLSNSELTPFINQEKGIIDTYFIKRLGSVLDQIESLACEHFPHRKKMINSAFKAHRDGNYIASIPLFLMLSEGVFRDLTEEDLFAKTSEPKTAKFVKKNKEKTIFPFMRSIIDAVSNGCIIGLRFSKNEDLEKYPNVLGRIRILHGADFSYDTEINAYKAISQFEFVTESVRMAFVDK